MSNFVEYVSDLGSDRRSSKAFRTLVRALLMNYLNDENKPYHAEEITIEVNDGFPNLTSDPTYIVIDPRDLVLERYIENLKFVSERGFMHILFVTRTNEQSDFIKLLQQKKPDTVAIHIWGIHELDELAMSYPQIVRNITNKKLEQILIEEKVEISLDSVADNWINEREKHIENLKKLNNESDITLCLGAGVSVDAKIPSWDNLVSKLLVSLIGAKFKEDSTLTPEYQSLLAEMLSKINKSSPLIEARYISMGLGDNFVNALTENLYSDLANDGVTPVLEAVAKLCTPAFNHARIKSVITYNFDDLLERNLSNRGGISYQSVCSDEDIVDSKNCLPIFHVHGFLPQNAGKYPNSNKSELVFSEEGYHSQYKEPYSWSNMTQMTCFRDDTCLFIGVSMTDPNLRRLLETAAKSKKTSSKTHYVIMRRAKLNEELDLKQEFLQKFYQTHHSLYEDSLSPLNLNIIWVNDFSEIPGILERIKGF